VENRKSREKKRICSEVSVNSPGNPWSQFMLMIFLCYGGAVIAYDLPHNFAGKGVLNVLDGVLPK